MNPLSKLPIVIASMSLGRAAVHDLEPKLAAAQEAGFDGIEVFWEDLVYHAKNYVSSKQREDLSALELNEEAMVKSAEQCKALCDKHGLSVLVLQPFTNYDGLVDKEKHEMMIAKMGVFIKVAKALGTDMIQIPSQMDSAGTTGEIDKIIQDITEIGHLGLREDPPIRFAYEALSWGAHVNLWQQAWEVVDRVNLPNVGTVLDTYHILANVYGDPTRSSGQREAGPADLAMSLNEMSRAGPNLVKKIFYIQLSDAERLDPPLSPSHPFWDPEMKTRMMWSRNARLFPCEPELGGYLPVKDVAKVLFEDIGYRGTVSLEVFSRSMFEPGERVPEEHAQRGMKSWRNMLSELETKSESK
ncbi:4-hydroxyphenylpyruvate dioxygenase [Rhodocollybia butyracea]|uniref:4-hydroxyphenylpyruvate dioxygenase n=1 Tax=Rhodocollybia butyracea TaxID=206335 RepID=A0A9P5Q5R1_9AGAR|nr:4-hydroxyphenylpyruvate dioxygenase [Rhodocollybia butyracea]